MRKILTLALALTLMYVSFASVTVEAPPKKADQIFLPVGKTGKTVSLLDLSRMSIREYESLTGRDLKLVDKAGFKLMQRDLRKSIAEDGTVNNKRLLKVLNKAEGEGGFHIGGFALGFLLGLIGVLIAYLINDERKKTRVKWAWIGLGIFVVLYLLLVLA